MTDPDERDRCAQRSITGRCVKYAGHDDNHRDLRGEEWPVYCRAVRDDGVRCCRRLNHDGDHSDHVDGYYGSDRRWWP